MSAWSMGLETLCVETNTEEGRSIFGRLSDMGSAICSEDGDVDREVDIWTRKAVCEIGCVD